MSAHDSLCAFARCDVFLESGSVLREGQRVKIIADSGSFVGIEWTDHEGLHTMAIRRERLRGE